MNQNSLRDGLLAIVAAAAVAVGALVAFPAPVRADAQCCGLGSGACPIGYRCFTDPPACNCYPLTCLGTCALDTDGK